MRNASAERDRADANVTKEHVPTFVRGFQVAAAGEGWHGPYQCATRGRRQTVQWLGSGPVARYCRSGVTRPNFLFWKAAVLEV